VSIGTNHAARGQLRSFVERVERLQTEIDDLNGDKKEVFAEAKANGYDVPTLKKVIQRRKADKSAVEEQDALLDLYEGALLGISQDDKDDDFLD